MIRNNSFFRRGRHLAARPLPSRTRRVVLAVLVLSAFAMLPWSPDLPGATLGPRVAAAETNSGNAAAPPAEQLWTCGMHPQVVQDHPGDCPICHMKLTPIASAAAATAGNPTPANAAAEAEQLWTCGMHPQVVQDHPGDCPICHMKLTPLESAATSASIAGSVVAIDPVVVQNMGVRTTPAIEGPLRREVRVAGFVEEAEPLIRDINLRVSGWIRRLHAHTEGLHVAKGDPLFDLYSPEIQVAVEELIALRKRREAPGGRDASLDSLQAATRRKLALFDIDEAEIARLSRLDRAPESIVFRSPISGDVTEKPVVDGSAVSAGEKVLRIVDHSTVWIDARVHEQDIALVSIGQRIEARLTAQADKVYAGEVVFIHPHLDETTRTASVRLAVPNPDGLLRPGMFATVVLRAELAPSAVLVPREAVIDTGDRKVAFVVGSDPGHFEPRHVTTGWIAEGGNVQILEGLQAGEEVVVSGQFLLDAESRLQDALRKFIAQRSSGAAAASTPPAGNVAPPPPAAHQH